MQRRNFLKVGALAAARSALGRAAPAIVSGSAGCGIGSRGGLRFDPPLKIAGHLRV